MNNIFWMRAQLSKHDPAWSVAYTPWGDKIICHITLDRVTRSSSGTTADDAFKNAYLMFWDFGESFHLMTRPVDDALASFLKQTWGYMLPKDTDFFYIMPTKEDSRFWIDALSVEYAKEGIDEETNSTDPVCEQFVLMPRSLVAHLLPDEVVPKKSDDDGI